MHCSKVGLETPHFTLHSSHFTLRTYTWHSTLQTSHCTLRTPHFASHCTLRTPHFTLHSPHFTLLPAIFTLHTSHFTLHTSHFTLHTALFTPHASHCTLHTPHFRFHTSSHLSSSHLIPAHLFLYVIKAFHESLPSTTSRTCMCRVPARPVRACFVRSCCSVVVQEHDLRATPVQCNAKRRLSSHLTLALRTVASWKHRKQKRVL